MSSSLRVFRNSLLRFDKYRIFGGRCSSSQSTGSNNDVIDITSVDEVPVYEAQITKEKEREIMLIRNKSGLNPEHRNMLNNLPPYNKQDLTWFHETIRYKKRMLGKYGTAGLNVSVGALWPLEDEIDDKNEYERVSYPNTLQENWEIIAKRNHEQAEKIRLREEELDNKMAKVKQWEKEYYMKLAKKEAEVKAALEKKERLMEEIRRQFGYKIDPRDARFQEAMIQKEALEKKRKKEAKKQERHAKFMANLLAASNIDQSKIVKTTDKKNEE